MFPEYGEFRGHQLHDGEHSMTSALTLEQFYAKQTMTDEEMHVARSLSREVMPLLQYSILEKIEAEFSGFQNNEYLAHVCNTIEVEHPEITEQQVELGRKMNGMLVKSLAQAF